MKLIIKLLILISVFNCLTYSQEQSRLQKIRELEKIYKTKNPTDKTVERRMELLDEILLPSAIDIAESRKISARAFRLFPDEMMYKFTKSYDTYGASVYPFTEISDYYSAFLLEYKQGSFVFNDVNQLGYDGFITNIGKIPIEYINEQNPEFTAISKYQPSLEIKDRQSEISIDNFTFRKKIKVPIGETYLLRIITKGLNGGILALKVQRKDTDSSIIIFVKAIKIFVSDENKKIISAKSPQINIDKAKIESALKKAGFIHVVIDTTTTPATLRGTVPNGKMEKMMLIATEASGKPLANGTTELSKTKRKKSRKKLQ